MRIEVHHRNEDGSFDHVATIQIPQGLDETVEGALEYAWRWTNNVEGSWSREEWADDARNWDWNPNVTVVKPIRVFQGQKLGHRSSMIGDRFIVDGKPYLVAHTGFSEEPST